MEKIEQQLYTLRDQEVPVGLHYAIMKQASYIRLRPLFFVVIAIFLCNLVILSSHINNQLIEAEFVDMIRDFTTDSYDSLLVLWILLEKFFEIISLEVLLSLLLNVAGTIYLSITLLSHKMRPTTY
jgi:hypothetical protein